MIAIKKFNFNLLLILSFTASSFAQTFTVKAHLTGFPEGTEFSLTNFETRQKITTASTKEGRFEMKGSLEQPTNLVLMTTLDNRKYYCFFLIGNENVTVTADKNDLPFYAHVSGSKYENEYEFLKKKNRAYDKLRDSISENVFELIKDTSSQGKKRILKIAHEQAYIDSITEKNTKEFLAEHLNTYAGIFRLFLLKKKFSFDTLHTMYKTLDANLQKSFYGVALAEYIGNGSVLNIGDKAIDFEAQDVSGTKQKLSNFKGKIVLLDFTETYCVPCIQSVDELKTIAKQYSNDVVIVSFCADKKKEVWLAGIKRDSPTWLCLWDGKGTTGDTPLKYGVNGYPTFVLIDKDGKIVSRDSGYSKGMLLRKVSEQLEK